MLTWQRIGEDGSDRGSQQHAIPDDHYLLRGAHRLSDGGTSALTEGYGDCGVGCPPFYTTVLRLAADGALLWRYQFPELYAPELTAALAADGRAAAVLPATPYTDGALRLRTIALLAFTLASLLCGLAQSMGMLVVPRALQGFGLRPDGTGSPRACWCRSIPAKSAARRCALLAMITVVAPIAGPILGGWITDNYSWEWIFLINVPLGILASSIVGSQLRHRPEQVERPKMDYVGLILLVIGVGALQLVLDLGNDEELVPFQCLIVMLACVAAVALVVFVIWELTDKDPIVDLRLFRHRNFRAGTLAMVVAYAAFFSVSLLIPQWLQRDMGYTAICGRPGDRADRHPAGDPDPVRRQVRLAFRLADAGEHRLHLHVVHQLLPIQLQPAGRLPARGDDPAGDGRGRGVVLHAGAADPAVSTWTGARSRRARALRPSYAPWVAASPPR